MGRQGRNKDTQRGGRSGKEGQAGGKGGERGPKTRGGEGERVRGEEGVRDKTGQDRREQDPDQENGRGRGTHDSSDVPRTTCLSCAWVR